MTDWQPIETAPKDGTIIVAITDYGMPCTMKWSEGYDAFVRVVTCRRCAGMGLGRLIKWTPLDLPEETS